MHKLRAPKLVLDIGWVPWRPSCVVDITWICRGRVWTRGCNVQRSLGVGKVAVLFKLSWQRQRAHAADVASECPLFHVPRIRSSREVWPEFRVTVSLDPAPGVMHSRG